MVDFSTTHISAIVSKWAYSLAVKQRSPKPPSQVRVLVGPQFRTQRKTAECGKPLFFRLFEDDARAERRIEFGEFDFAFDFLFILACPDNVI